MIDVKTHTHPTVQNLNPGKTSIMTPFHRTTFSPALLLILLCQIGSVKAVTTVLFHASQPMQLTTEGTGSDTYTTEGYIITVTRDKLFTGGVGMHGRDPIVVWPAGLQAQGGISPENASGKANVSIKRADEQPFAITSFSFKLLASTTGAGASLEVMPLIDGEDGLNDPVPFDATGYYGKQFPPVSTPQFSGHNYDSYKFTLYVDFAITALTLVDASPVPAPAPAPPAVTSTRPTPSTMKLSWPVNGHAYKLETCTDLTVGDWVPQASIQKMEAGNNVVTVVLTGNQRFFRLSN